MKNNKSYYDDDSNFDDISDVDNAYLDYYDYILLDDENRAYVNMPSHQFTITTSDRDYVINVLYKLQRNPRNSNLFQPILSGEFIIGIETEYINNRFIYNRLREQDTLSIYMQYATGDYVILEEEPSFKNKDWMAKFFGNVARNFTFDELVDLIIHCYKSSRMKALK